MPVSEDDYSPAHGCHVRDLYVGVPHQLPPRLWSAVKHPPDAEDGDGYVEGDHDWHSCVPLLNAVTYTGHQWPRVQAIAKEAIREIGGE